MNIKVTVFTPTFNRAYIIDNLYKSLIEQTFKNFEWIIIDDGSTDNTEVLINSFIEEGKLNIIYQKQLNSGKHRAINKAVDIAHGELFFIVDSDDYLTEDALEILVSNWDNIEDKGKFCGISGLRGYNSEKIVGSCHPNYIFDCSILEYRYKYKIKGDKAEAFVTEKLKIHKFPEIEGEKFISESIVWNRLGEKYLMRWVNEIIYICNYLEDGLSAKSLNLRINNINGTLLLYKSNLDYDIPYSYKLKNIINYYRFLFHAKLPIKKYKIENALILNIIGMIGGGILYILDFSKLEN